MNQKFRWWQTTILVWCLYPKKILLLYVIVILLLILQMCIGSTQSIIGKLSFLMTWVSAAVASYAVIDVAVFLKREVTRFVVEHVKWIG